MAVGVNGKKTRKMNQPPVPKLVKDFWPRFSAHTANLSLLLAVGSLAPAALTLYVTGLFARQLELALILLFVQFATVYLMLFFLATVTTRPTKHLLSALTFATGEKDGSTPPNPNETRFKRTGLGAAIEAIYATLSKEGREQNTDTLATATSQVEKALEATQCGFVTYDAQRSMTYANPATPVSETTDGTKVLDLLFQPEDALEQWWDECAANAVRAEKTWTRVPDKLPGEEGRRLFDVIASYNKGLADELILTLVDRTEDYAIGEEELDFIAFAAHELRGPITVIRGYLDVLQDELQDELDTDHKELFHRLVVSANRLSTYINNILNTSKYDRHHLNVQLKETTVRSVYSSVADDMELRARAQRRLLSVSIPDTLPTIAADNGSLSEVFSNLVDNAIKYSNEGGTINVSAVSKGDTVEVAITDHGIGMPSNVVSNLFQKFYRSHRSRETVAGTGIGLYISKAIVESHGGTIAVASEDGRGSTFTVILPTYDSVAEKLKAGNNESKELLGDGKSWIRNHNMYRG
ncbi:HAMP domain-containing histidine kinase [Candidatus Saccharibacteria bacterium TM7i]|nr:HAMP domain-containing histidine kinase [Candidatus Saccharibacteria bacterium TM7i]